MYRWQYENNGIIKIVLLLKLWAQEWCNMLKNEIYYQLILLVLKLEYSGRMRSKPCLLMPWLHASKGHRLPCYWLYRMNRCVSSIFYDLNYLQNLNTEKKINQNANTFSCFFPFISILKVKIMLTVDKKVECTSYSIFSIDINKI